MKVRQELSAKEVEQLHASLARRLGDSSVPTLPQVAVKIVELIGNPNSTIKQFADVIQTDQALTGRLLRLSNSAMFAQRQPVTTLQRAMVLIGMEKLKALALGFHLSRAMAACEGPFSLKRLWTQSLFRAWLALHIAETLDKRISGEAFIVGLLSDVGVAVMPKLIGDEYAARVNPGDAPQKQYLTETRFMPHTHVDVAVVLAKVWKLPDLLSRPIQLHHSPALPASKDDPASILHAAAHYVGIIALDPAGQSVESLSPGLAERLFGLDTNAMQGLVDRSRAAFRGSKDIFSHMLDPALSLDSIVERAVGQMQADHDVVDNAVETEWSPRKFHAVGLVFEFQPGPENRVTAFISDEAGNRLVAEEIDPGRDSETRIREKLLLEDAKAEDVKQIMRGIRALAA